MNTSRSGMRTQVLGALLGSLVFTTGCGPMEPGMPEEDLGASAAVEDPKAQLGTRQDEVVYGVDNRTDVYAHTDASLRMRAHQSTVVLMSAATVNLANPNAVTFNTQTLGQEKNLCAGQRFFNDPAAGFCSGTLIDDDLVLTAGHCIDAGSCGNTRIVFNYYKTSDTTLQTVTSQDVFSCQSVVARALGTVGGKNLDYAIVRLNRSAYPRFTPAPVRTQNAPLAVGQAVAVIGSGSGIPYKIDAGGAVRDARPGMMDFFVANTDTFQGNSGSGVYELDTETVAGILVRGETDYVANGSCNIVNTCASNLCRGEDITYVRPALDAFCATNTSRRLCGETLLTNTLTYDRVNTASATVNTANATIALQDGQTVLISTCAGMPGAFAGGDTYLRLVGPSSVQVASSDDSFGGACSTIRYTVPVGGYGNYELRAGCFSGKSCRATAAWSTSMTVYATFNTNSATSSTVNFRLALTQGQTLNIGTCGLTGSSFLGDTFLRLYDPQGNEATFSDDACGGSGSNIKYTIPSGKSGVWELRAGCYGATACSGGLAWTVSGGPGSLVYSAASTTSATVNTINQDLLLSAGTTLTLGTCGTPNAYTPSDTYLRLFNPGGLEVAQNDDACASGSKLTYVVPADGIYQLRAGCYSATTCSGTVGFSTL